MGGIQGYGWLGIIGRLSLLEYQVGMDIARQIFATDVVSTKEPVQEQQLRKSGH